MNFWNTAMIMLTQFETELQIVQVMIHHFQPRYSDTDY